MSRVAPISIVALGVACAFFADSAIEFALASLVIAAGWYELLRECEVAERQ